MRKLKMSLLITYCIVGIGRHSCAGEADVSPKAVKTSNKYATLTIDYYDAVNVADRHPLRFRLENTGVSVIMFARSDIYQLLRIVVVDDLGASVPLTRFGKAVTAKQGFSARSLATVAPGKVFEAHIDLLRMFDMTLEGRYRYTIHVDEGFQVLVPPNAIANCRLQIADVPLRILGRDSKSKSGFGPGT